MRKLLFGLLGLLWVLPVMAVDYSNCQNLFDGEYISVSNGAKAENANNIYVSPGERYVALWTTSVSHALNLYGYDTQGNQVGAWTSGAYASNGVSTPFSDNYMAWQNGAVFTVPDGVAYLRFNTFGNLGASQQQAWAESLKIYNMDCVEKITIASTKYVETEFNALNTALANAVATVNTVVTQTIAQAASIATLQSGKQTRPDETCPARKKCLLVTDENNIPHWYEIVEPLLPAGYIQLQWIESTGTQYIDTGIKANASIVVDMGVLFSRIGSTYVALGTRNGTNTSDTNIFQFGINSNNTFFHRYGIGTYDGTGVPVAQTLYDVHLENYKEIISNGQDTYTNTFEFNPDMDTEGTLYIFATHDISSSGRIFSMAGYITYLSISVDGVLVRDFVPAKNPDGKIGMYDTVNGVFYENEGTGEFIAGPVAE